MRGYFVYPALFSFFLVCALLSGGHWLAIGVTGYFLLRLYLLKKKTIFFTSLIIGGCVLFFASIHQHNNQTSLVEDSGKFLIELQMDDVKYDGNQMQFYGIVKETAQQKKLSETVVVFYYVDSLAEKDWWQSQQHKQELIVEGTLTPPESNRNQYQFNYKQFLFNKRVHWVLSADQLTVLSNSENNTFWQNYSLTGIKQHLIQHIDQNMTPKTADYMKTLLLGDVGAFEKELLQQFKDLGLLHLLSISGLHIQFLFSIFSYVLLRAGMTKESSYFLLVPILFFYGSLIGWGTSSFRAVVASFIALSAARFNIRISTLDVWSMTMIAALIVDPYQVSSVGFQLSYVLSLLLVLFSKTFLASRYNYWTQNLLISFVMTVASTPILMFHFFEFPWMGTIANLLFIPFFSWILIPLLIYLMLSFLLSGTVFFEWLLQLLEVVLSIPEWIALWLSKIPFNLIVTGRIPLFLMGLFCSALILWFISLETKKHRKKAALGGLMIFLAAVQYQTYSPFGEVVMIDVGQGDAFLIKEPFGQGNYLIDTGGMISFGREEEWMQKESPSTVANRHVLPLLKAKGIRKLTNVFVSHGDADHIQALTEIAEELPIDEVIFPSGTESKELFLETAYFLKKKSITLTSVVADKQTPVKVTSFLYVLWPFEVGEGENKDSLVLYGQIGAYKWLFTGDLGVEEEKKLLAEYPNLKVDVLKVGHHGSHTSTSESFLQQIDPDVALISVKKANQFGHPHGEVIDSLKRGGIKIFRTDLNGAVHYKYFPFKWGEYSIPFETILKEDENF